MKIEKSDIAGKLAMLKNAIPSKPPFECMKGVLLKDGFLTATNLELTISAAVECNPGETFIIPQRAVEMIENLPDGQVEIVAEGKGESIRIRAGTINNRFQSFASDEFPEVPRPERPTTFSVDIKNLQETISAIMYAVGTNCSRPQQNGLLFDGDGENLNLVSCDGFRIAWAHLALAEKFKFIIPRPSMQVLLGLGLVGKVKISYDYRYGIFETDDFSVCTRLLEGEFLDYRKAFPTGGKQINLDRAEIMGSLKRAIICGEDRAKSKIDLDFSDAAVCISAKSSFGDYREVLPLSESIGDLGISFNARYLTDCVKSYRGEQLACTFNSSVAPMVVDDGTIRSMVLPVRRSKQ